MTKPAASSTRVSSLTSDPLESPEKNVHATHTVPPINLTNATAAPQGVGYAPVYAYSPPYEDEIDLRPYVEAVITWWREILLIAIGLALLAGLTAFALRLLPPTYESSADVALVRVQSDVKFDERFLTRSDTDLTTSNASARRSALLSMATSTSLAQKVIDQVGDLLNPDERVAADLVENVTAVNNPGGRTESDLIRITVKANSPEKAAQLASTWAELFVKEANSVYGQSSSELLQSVEMMLTQATSDYETAQRTLEDFLATSRADELGRLIALKEATIAQLQQSQQDLFKSYSQQLLMASDSVVAAYVQADAQNKRLRFEEEQEGEQAQLRAYVDVQYSAKLDAFQRQVEYDAVLLRDLYAESLRLQKVLSNVKALRTQIESGPPSVEGSTVVALQLLRIQAYNDLLRPDSGVTQLGDSPIQVQLDAKSTWQKESALAEADGILQSLQKRQGEIQQQINDLNQRRLQTASYPSLAGTATVTETAANGFATVIQRQEATLTERFAASAPLSNTLTANLAMSQTTPLQQLLPNQMEQLSTYLSSIEDNNLVATQELEAEVRQLKQQLEAERARQQTLTQNRDRTRTTLDTVNNKVDELRVTQAAASSEVRLAGGAVAPVDPVKRLSILLSLVAGGAVGLFLGLFWALLANFLGKRPFLSRRVMGQVG